MKELLAYIATALIVVAYFPYVLDIIKSKTKPHPYTWFISGFITFIVFGLQIKDGASWGALPTFIGAVAGVAIFLLALYRNKKDMITNADKVSFVMAIIACILWLGVKNPVAAVLFLVFVDIFAFFPTVRKSWTAPGEETISTYVINFIRFVLSCIAVENYTFVTLAYPLSAAILDCLICAYLIIRKNKTQEHNRI
jgi:hypothetical protein